MLKIEVNQHEGELMIETHGTLPEIVSDLGAVIHAIHVKACNDDIFVGREFERVFRDPEFHNLVFRPNKDDAELLASAENFGKGGNE